MPRADVSNSTRAPAVQSLSIPKLNRRSLLAGAAAAIVVAGRANAAGEPPEALRVLWRQRTALVAQSHALAAQMAAAVASMPEWARPGPAYIDGKGRPCGETVPFPRRLNAKLPTTPNGRRLVRPSRLTIEEEYRSDRRSNPAEADAIRARRLAALEERLAAQRAAEDRAGVEDLQLAIEANWQAALDIEAEIRTLPVTFNATAALLLIDISYDAQRSSTVAMPDTALAAALRPLQFIRPVLTGEVAADVGALLDSPKASLSSHRFCAE